MTKMYHKFLVAGVVLQPYRFPDGQEIIPGGQMKSQARRASHRVLGGDDKVGPTIRFERYDQILDRPLTKRELVFGVKSPNDGQGGGFAGLVAWCGYEGSDLQPEVRIDLARARMVNASEWIVQFVREVILAAGWAIQSEEE